MNNIIDKNYAKNIGKTIILAQKQTLKSLLDEIKEQDYETVSQIKGAIYGTLEILEKIEAAENE